MELLDIIEQVEKSYGITVNNVLSIDEGVSCSQILESTNGKYVMKTANDAFKDTMNDSLDILLFLETKDFNVPRVIKNLSGDCVTEFDDNTIILYEYIEANEIEPIFDYKKLGTLVGELHLHLSDYKQDLLIRDKYFFIDRYIEILTKKNYDINKIEKYKRLGDFLWTKLEKLEKGYCHGDLHTGNIILDKKFEYNIIDFDTSCMAYSIYDVMIVCNLTDYFEFNETALKETYESYRTFLSEYTKLCKVSKEEEESLYYLIGIYHYQLQATIVEIYGLDCIDHTFIDKQLEWLEEWMKATTSLTGLQFDL
ncbi:hypothetical protein EZV73_01885 [Acidaminobacter sp. JC074]|uniref:phosphotransferase enzyme family protein n=1 Tax=Acidaminobacter sp. JC074 TaxID=2530199 RepID=UPI001F0E7B85|nr:phosphotransferase [Acidaminobacter sp. JC074]MCH4886295.1 hypothetical protein [Acidaminobacter sp. JC074]